MRTNTKHLDNLWVEDYRTHVATVLIAYILSLNIR